MTPGCEVLTISPFSYIDLISDEYLFGISPTFFIQQTFLNFLF